MTGASGQPRLRIGIDTGGTFTDIVAVESGSGLMRVTKVASTPANPAIGLVRGVKVILDEIGKSADDVVALAHGTTVATNALLQGEIHSLGLVVTAGFRHILEIARQSVPEGYGNSYFWLKPERIVPLRFVREVGGRLNFRGEELRPLDEESVRAAAHFFCRAEIRAVGVCLIHSYANAAHERRVAEIFGEEYPGCTLSLSCAVLREYREYERAVTTLVDAFVKPHMHRYLQRVHDELGQGLNKKPFLVMQSSGGVASREQVVDKPITTALSGPAAGALGSAVMAEIAGFPDVVTLDADAMARRFNGVTVVGPASKPSDPVDLPGRPVSLADETISLVERTSSPDQTISWENSRAHQSALRLETVQQAASANPSVELEGPPVGPDAGLGSPVAMPPAWKLSKHRRFIGGFCVGFTAVLLLGVGIHIVTLFSTNGQMAAFGPGTPVFQSPPLASSGASTISAQPVQRSVLAERTLSKLQLNDEEIAALVAGGRQLMVAGDIPNARSVLQQAAEAGNATAALELGATYDPFVLQQLAALQRPYLVGSSAESERVIRDREKKVVGEASVERARGWYEKARGRGSTEAAVRIDRLRSVPIELWR